MRLRASSPLGTSPTKRRCVEFVCDVYTPEVHVGVLDYARTAGWSILDSKCYLPTTLLSYSEPCDGTLAIAGTPELNEWLKKQANPVVRLVCSLDPTFPSVEPDYMAIGVIAAGHLLTLGSPNLAFYRYAEAPDTRKLWEGFSGALAAAGRAAHLIDYVALSGYENVKAAAPRQVRWQWLSEKLAALPRPLALLVEDDRFASDVIEAAAILGWRIPEDMAVLGVDNRALILAKLPIPLSSVDSDLYSVGWEGAALLDRLMNGEEPPSKPIVVPPKQVVPRFSTATFVCDYPEVSYAVTQLRARFHEGVRVEEICRMTRTSPRCLQMKFKEVLGHSITDELVRIRIEHAARLLRETDLKLDSIALESGLRSARYLCDVFRREFGTSPAAYRESERGARKIGD